MKVSSLIIDNSNPRSISSRMRRRRFELFRTLVSAQDGKSLKILDVGGTQKFWEVMGFASSPHFVTLLNIAPVEVNHDNFRSVVGDGRDLHRYDDKEFDIVFSNSVIEHVGGFEDQKAMADEMQRVGKQFFVQTPNFYFPIEPHYVFPAFHWLPIKMRVWMLLHFNVGRGKKKKDRLTAEAAVKSIRLLKRSELVAMFPRASFYGVRFLGLTKSFVLTSSRVSEPE